MTTVRSLVVISCKFDINVMCFSKRLHRSRSKFVIHISCEIQHVNWRSLKEGEGANFLRNFEVLERERTKQGIKKEKVTGVAASVQKFYKAFV